MADMHDRIASKRQAGFAEGATVMVTQLDDVQRYMAGVEDESLIKGTIVNKIPSTSDTYVVEVNGKRLALLSAQLKLVEKTMLQAVHEATPGAAAAMANSSVAREEQDDGLTTDLFDVEIARLMSAKVQGLSSKLVDMKTAWVGMRDQELGAKLTKYVDYALPYLDHLIVLVGVAKSESDLRSAVSSFKEMMELSSEVTNDQNISAWVELQLDQISDAV